MPAVDLSAIPVEWVRWAWAALALPVLWAVGRWWRKVQLERKVLRRMLGMHPHHKAVLARFVHAQLHTLVLDPDEPATKHLIRQGVLLQGEWVGEWRGVAAYVSVTELFYVLLQRWARQDPWMLDHLRQQRIDAP